uniref:Retrotransposon gag domain-containing protein n=1 Tax=Ananas comosus var. bracteatus TaxID=296719 RepID=A0A6V7Q9H6_ANACO|nr:unnamed protein product [Ananas comosus var. bracteatus]
METLFEDLYTLEWNKVNLAMHYLKQSTKVWWKGVKRDRSPSLHPMAWEEFRGMLFSAYFPDSEKMKLQERFWKLRQGERSVRQYEREFSRIVHCIPNVVRDDKDKADCFVSGFRPDLYKAVLILKSQTFAEVLDRALCIEQGNAFIQEERESYYKKKRKRMTNEWIRWSVKFPADFDEFTLAIPSSRGPPQCTLYISDAFGHS